MAKPPLFESAIDSFTLSLAHGETHRNLRAPSKRYQQNAALWMVETMGIPESALRWDMHPQYNAHHWDGTPNPLLAVCDFLSAGYSTAAESGTGTGKTFLAALLVMWFLDCFENSRVITLAPKADQLKLNLWKEISAFEERFKRRRPDSELTTLKLRVRPGRDQWLAVGYPVGVAADEKVATRAAGFHEEHMLFIFEEMPGIHQSIVEAVYNTCTAPHNLQLALGNPDNAFDTLHVFTQNPNVKAVRISALDHPNVVCNNAAIIPGAVSRKTVDERRLKYGEDHPLYISRVRGISPPQATDALIKLEWCLRAARKELTPELTSGPRAMGVDVANSEDGDLAAIAVGKGANCEEVTAFPCPNANEMAQYKVVPHIRAGEIAEANVGIDGVGVGAGAVNECKRHECYVQSLMGGPIFQDYSEEKFVSLRAQMHWQLRLDLMFDRIRLPNDPELFADLCTPHWGTRNGKIYVEEKEQLKKRLPGGRSPNKGDAVVYWNWVRQSIGVATIGGDSVTF